MKRIVFWSVAVIVGLIAASCTCNFGTYGDGVTYGYVTTVEDNGTWAAVHIRASYNTSQTDCYNVGVSDRETLADLDRAVVEEHRIKATFKKERRAGTSLCSTGTITGVEFLGNVTDIERRSGM